MMPHRSPNPTDRTAGAGSKGREKRTWYTSFTILNQSVTAFKRKHFPALFLLSLCVGLTTWLYTHQVYGPWADAKDAQKGGIKAQMWDLYPRWVGARELLLHGRNPYGAEVSHEIQLTYYGHIVTPEESARRVVDEQRFAYPIYVVFLMAPTISLDFGRIQFWAPYVLGAFALLSVLFSIWILEWKLPRTAVASLVLLVMSSPQIVQGLRHQQLAVVVACLLVAGAWCVHRGWLITAGIVLAYSTIKPQMALLPLAWFLVWATGEWRTRWRLVVSFASALTALVGAGELLVPGWIGDFIAAMQAYRKYFPTTSLPRLLLGDMLGIVASCAIVIWLMIYATRNRKASGDSDTFAWVFAAFLMATVLAFPLFTPFNQVLLILPALLVLRDWARLPKFSRAAFLFIIFWPWITSLVLLIMHPALNPESHLPLIPALAASAVPLLLPAVLYTKPNASMEPSLSKKGLDA